MKMFEFEVVGVKYRAEAFRAAQVKQGDWLKLKAEPGNEHDPNAIAVYKDAHHIGYVPRHETKDIRELVQAGNAVCRCTTAWALGCHMMVRDKTELPQDALSQLPSDDGK